MDTYEQMGRDEARELRRYAVKHHSEHTTYEQWCRKCDKINLHDYGRSIGVVRERAACCKLCSTAAFTPRSFRG